SAVRPSHKRATEVTKSECPLNVRVKRSDARQIAAPPPMVASPTVPPMPISSPRRVPKILPVIVKRPCSINPSYMGLRMLCVGSQSGEVPELDRVIAAASERGASIAREHDRIDVAGMARQRVELPAAPGLP